MGSSSIIFMVGEEKANWPFEYAINGVIRSHLKMKKASTTTNSRYKRKKNGGPLGIKTKALGNFHFTENNYLIIGYYRDIWLLIYDGLIGIGKTSKFKKLLVIKHPTLYRLQKINL